MEWNANKWELMIIDELKIRNEMKIRNEFKWNNGDMK